MADHYEDYTREQLVRLLRERDKRPSFGLCGVLVAKGLTFAAWRKTDFPIRPMRRKSQEL